MKIIIDNGHGENTLGKRSPEWQNGRQLMEYEFNRDLAVQLSNLLNEENYENELLVPELDDIPIRERVNRADEIHAATPSVLISLHGNAAPNMDSRPHGIETFHYSPAGKVFADAVHAELIRSMQWKDRGVRKAYQRIRNKKGKRITIYKIAILKFTDPVAILTENGFYTNFDQCMEMLKADVRTNIAQATFVGIKHYLLNLNQ